MEIRVDDRNTYVYTGTRPITSGRQSWLFVHGAGMDHSVWILQSRYFAFHGANVLAVDLPGHGRSAGEALPSIEEQADWLARLLEAAGIESVIAAGHSMGSLAVLELAARHPARVRGLALVGSGFPMAVAQALLDAAAADDHRAIDLIMGWGLSPRSHLGGNRAPGLWMVGEGVVLLEQSRPGVLHTGLKACNDYRAGLDSAAAVRCPVRFIIGRQDQMTPPRAAAALADAIGGSEKTVLADCGHMIPLERPDELLDALIDFRLSCI